MPKTRFMVVSAPNTGDGEEARGFVVVDEVGRREEVDVKLEVRWRVGVEFVCAEGLSIIGFFLGKRLYLLEVGIYIAGEAESLDTRRGFCGGSQGSFEFGSMLESGTIASMNNKAMDLYKTLDEFWGINLCRKSSKSDFV